MAFPDKNYTLGSGKLYFAPFAPGTLVPATGQEYFGNTPSLNNTSDRETLDHYDADNGLRTKDKSVTTSLDRSGSFTTDHVSPSNLAKWFGGANSIVTQTSQAGQTDTITVVPGRRYQLGKSVANPAGLRGMTMTSVATTDAQPVSLVELVDFTFDGATGGITILPGSTVVEDEGTEILVTFALEAVSYNKVVSSSAEISGELFFRADNGEGLNQDYYWPYVKITPDGDMEIKGEDWQTLPFNIEVLKRDDNTEAVYILGRPGQGV